MSCGITLNLKTEEARETVAARLAAAIAPAPSALSIKPIRVADWLSLYQDKSFVGSLNEDNFKLVLLNTRRSGLRWRGNAVIIVGTIEDNVVHVLLRPPIFNQLFSLLWTVSLCVGFALSFFGPSNTLAVHLLLAAMLIFPLALILGAFWYEARLAERTLRNVLGAAIV